MSEQIFNLMLFYFIEKIFKYIRHCFNSLPFSFIHKHNIYMSIIKKKNNLYAL